MTNKEVETNLDVGILNNNEWVHRWAIGKTGFHQSTHDPLLESVEDQIFGGKTKSVFAPLCGKSPDLIWMYERGHTVCGVELVEQAVTEFFTENNIPNDVQDLGVKGKQYKSKDGRLVIFCADLFDMDVNRCGQFDVIWDSRSFVAINTADHNRYVDLLLSLMRKDGLYYISTLEYDNAVWPGPPHSIPNKVLQEAYGSRCMLELVQEKDNTGQNINKQGETEKPQTSPAVSGAAAAIRTSSFNYNRWHKLTFK